MSRRKSKISTALAYSGYRFAAVIRSVLSKALPTMPFCSCVSSSQDTNKTRSTTIDCWSADPGWIHDIDGALSGYAHGATTVASIGIHGIRPRISSLRSIYVPRGLSNVFYFPSVLAVGNTHVESSSLPSASASPGLQDDFCGHSQSCEYKIQHKSSVTLAPNYHPYSNGNLERADSGLHFATFHDVSTNCPASGRPLQPVCIQPNSLPVTQICLPGPRFSGTTDCSSSGEDKEDQYTRQRTRLFSMYDFEGQDDDVWDDAVPVGPGQQPVGVLFNGQTTYKIFGLLGVGSFGVVVLAEADDGVIVAIKIFDKDIYDSVLNGAEQLGNEMAVMAKAVGGMRAFRQHGDDGHGESERAQDIEGVPSPFLTHLLSCWEDEENVYLVMRFYARTLHSILQSGRVRPREAKIYCAQLALGIFDLHEMGVIHRDLKPENIIVDMNGNLVLTDFGAAYFPPASSTPFSECITYRRYGTYGYFAPEVLSEDLGKDGYGPKVDVFSLGLILWEILSGSRTPPYETDTQYADAKNYLLMEWIGDDKARDLVEKMLDENPRTRLSVRDVLEHPYFSDLDLTALREGHITPSYKPSKFPRCRTINKKLLFPDFDPSYVGQYFRHVWNCAPERRCDLRNGMATRPRRQARSDIRPARAVPQMLTVISE